MENKTKTTDKNFSWLLGEEDETEYESTPQKGTEVPETERPTNEQDTENTTHSESAQNTESALSLIHI